MRFLILCVLLILFGCHAIPKIDIQGHRGARGLLPENTIPAFKEALKLGVQTLELDVVISKDGQVVVSHEPFMNHEITLDVDGKPISESDEKGFNLYQMTYDSIRLYDVGTKTHPRFPDQKKMKVAKPLLSEVIQMAEAESNKKVQYNIEIKSQQEYDGVFSPQVEDFVRMTLEVIQSYGISKRVTLQSFDTRALEAIHKQHKNIKTALLVDENESIEERLSQLTFKPKIISPYFELLDTIEVEKLHRMGYKVIPWTINTEKDINKMIDLKVDGIISDFPDLVIKLYKERL